MGLNILIVCEHASDVYGGEAVLPLHYFRMLSKRSENVFLLTHVRVRPLLELTHGINNDHVYYMPDTWLHKFLHKISIKLKLPERISFTTLGALMHFLTQFYQRSMAKKIIGDKGIDVVHEPAPVSPKQPSMLFGLGVPVIIGPMNGGMNFPSAFSYLASGVEKKLYFVFRAFSNILNILIPGKLLATRLLVANQRTFKALPLFRLGNVSELVENGVEKGKITEQIKKQNDVDTIQVLYAGRLVELKMVDILIRAINSCKTNNIKLTIVGDGPEKSSLQALAASYDNDRVRFTGWVPYETIIEYYDTADIFTLPSVRECGGAVVLEAMARGVPVIATNWGGPADYLDKKTGFLVSPDSYEAMVIKFAQFIDLLANDNDLRTNMGAAAIQKVRSCFTWEDKIDTMLSIYNEVCSEK